jgi:hypothetical protein
MQQQTWAVWDYNQSGLHRRHFYRISYRQPSLRCPHCWQLYQHTRSGTAMRPLPFHWETSLKHIRSKLVPPHRPRCTHSKCLQIRRSTSMQTPIWAAYRSLTPTVHSWSLLGSLAARVGHICSRCISKLACSSPRVKLQELQDFPQRSCLAFRQSKPLGIAGVVLLSASFP